MSDLRKSAQMALYALELERTDPGLAPTVSAIEMLKAALAQPEPVNQCGEVCERAKLCAICASDLAEANKRLEALAQPEPEQEPVAWMQESTGCIRFDWWFDKQGYVPLYTHPPQRTWVGLTDQEIAQGSKELWVAQQAFESAVWWAEAKLKEKNGG